MKSKMEERIWQDGFQKIMEFIQLREFQCFFLVWGMMLIWADWILNYQLESMEWQKDFIECIVKSNDPLEGSIQTNGKYLNFDSTQVKDPNLLSWLDSIIFIIKQNQHMIQHLYSYKPLYYVNFQPIKIRIRIGFNQIFNWY